jgi:hypothetical protein
VRAEASTRPCTWMCNRASPAGEGAGSGTGEAGELRAAGGAVDALRWDAAITLEADRNPAITR